MKRSENKHPEIVRTIFGSKKEKYKIIPKNSRYKAT